MSAQVCILIIVVVIFMAILFRKIVRTDARDDFRIKNILKYSDTEENSTSDYQNIQKSVQESMNFSSNNEYKTEVHSEKDSLSQDIQPEPKQQENIHYSKDFHENTYEEKINDERYIKSDDYFEKYESPNNIKDKKIKKDVHQMIKSFYKGITFTIGILVCLYALFGVIKFAQTTDDAIIYSIWLLIGVILIK